MSKKGIYAIAVSFILAFVYGCGTIPVQPTATIQVSFDNDIPCTNDSSLYEFLDVMSFHSDAADGFIKRIDRMLFANHRIYVVDVESNKVMMYDEKGTFIKSTSQYIGNASNEYIRFMDATTDGQYIYLSCDAPYKILKFDGDLNFIESTTISMYLTEIATDGKFLYGIRPCGTNANAHELVGYCLGKMDDSPISVLPPTQSVRGRMIMGKSLTCDKGKVYANLPFDTNLYVIANGGIENRYELDFGKNGLLSNPIPQDISPDEFDAEYGDMVWGIVNLNVSDSIFLFNTNLGGMHIVNRNEMTKGGCTTILNDYFPISSSKILPCVGHGNEVVFELNEMLINFLLKDYETNVQKVPVLKEIKRKYEKDGGPLVAIWRIR